jgi:hypothetical protein
MAGVSCIGTFRNNRKSGCRFIWENNGHSDEYLIKLSSILNHSSTSITNSVELFQFDIFGSIYFLSEY